MKTTQSIASRGAQITGSILCVTAVAIWLVAVGILAGIVKLCAGLRRFAATGTLRRCGPHGKDERAPERERRHA